MSIFTWAETEVETVEQQFDKWWDTSMKPVLQADIEPIAKKFWKQFSSQFGLQAITDALGAVASLSTGALFGTVATGLATTLYTQAKTDAASDASLDATQILQTVQSALQVAKATSNVVTPADQNAVAAISAPPPNNPTSTAA